MAATVSLTGLVLAGGASRRMGHDKATLRVGDARLVDHVAAVLASVCDAVLVASGDGRRLPDLAHPQVADPDPDQGPLGAIVAGLAAADTPLLAVVAVDLPDANADVLRLLRDRWTGEDAVVPWVAGRAQPLHAVWATRSRDVVAQAYAGGERSPTRLLDRLDVSYIGEGEWGTVADGRFAVNVNRPADARAHGLERPRC